MARDNFNKSVIEKLKARVAHRCSNPNCRVPTAAPSSGDAVNNIGIAAHICAASPKGPRYDKSMSTKARKSIDNAIWLCSNCSIDIDRDEERYTVDILEKWKQEAENSARRELGKKLPSNTDTIDAVVAALTGCPKSYMAEAIPNVHKATKKSLESLDPRFFVETTYKPNKTQVQISAREPVSLPVKIRKESAKEYLEKHKQLIEHGRDIEIDSEAISIEGSKLFEELFNKNKGTFYIPSKKINAIQKIWLVGNEKSIVESFNDINGTIEFGTKSFTFKGTTFNGIFKVECQVFMDETKSNIKISTCFKQWEGVDIKMLPYFDKLFSLYSKMSKGWKFFTSLELNGLKILTSKGMEVNEWENILRISDFLHYIDCSKIIAKEYDTRINYTSNVAYTAEEHQNITDIAETIKGKKEYTKDDISKNASCELTIDESIDTLKELIESKEAHSIKMIQQIRERIKLFGVEVELPPLQVSLDSVIPEIYGNIDKLNTGDIVKVEWVPQDNFKYSVNYKS